MGLRKTLDDPWVRNKIIKELKRQPFVKPACYSAGIHPQRFFEWRRKWLEDDPEAEQFHEFFEACEMARGQLECDWVADIAHLPKGTRGKQWVLGKFKRGTYGASAAVGLDGIPAPPKAIAEMSESEVKAYLFVVQTWLQKKLSDRDQLRQGVMALPEEDEDDIGQPSGGRGALPGPGPGAAAGDEEDD